MDEFNEIFNFITNIAISIIVLFGLILLISLSVLLFKEFQKERKNLKNLKLIFDSDLPTYNLFSMFDIEIDFKIAKFRNKQTPDQIVSWGVLIDLMTRVGVNIFDDYGNEKAVLNSFYQLFKNTKSLLYKTVGASNSVSIILLLLNKGLRPFLAKWDCLINQEKCFESEILNEKQKNDLKSEFRLDYQNFIIFLSKEKILESLLYLSKLKYKSKNPLAIREEKEIDNSTLKELKKNK